MMEVEAAAAAAGVHHPNPFFPRQHVPLSRLQPPPPPLTTTTATPSPDSAIHSAHYSPSQSPPTFLRSGGGGTGGGGQGHGLSRNNSDASQYSSAGASPLSPSRSFSPAHSPIQTRHPSSSAATASRHLSLPALFAAQAAQRGSPMGDIAEVASNRRRMEQEEEERTVAAAGNLQQVPPHLQAGGAMQAAGISRQQLINRYVRVQVFHNKFMK